MQKLSWILALLSLGLVISYSPIQASNQSSSTADCELIAVANMSPQAIMMLLGLCSEDSFVSGKDISWNASDVADAEQEQDGANKVTVSPMMPKGIKAVISVSNKKSLLVIGDKPSIEQMKTVLAMLDVTQKQVQVATEVYEVKPGTMQVIIDVDKPNDKKTDARTLKTAFVSPEVLKGFKTQLTNERASKLGAPIISTINNQLASISISNSIPVTSAATDNDAAKKWIDMKTEVRVLPRINADGTITLTLKAIIPRSNKSDVENAKSSESPLTATFRVKSGESMILYEAAKESEDWLLLIVTPTVVPDAQDQSASVPAVVQ